MLITGRSQAGPPSDYVDIVLVHTQRSYLQELESAWWCQYKVQCFESLTPTRKWIDAKINISVGDIVLIQYSSKSAAGTYRIGRVQNVEIDTDNLVRTCTVQYHLCKPGLKADSVRKEMRVSTQRLVLILPIEDQTS